jgi:hypothetical protein
MKHARKSRAKASLFPLQVAWGNWTLMQRKAKVLLLKLYENNILVPARRVK